MYRRFGKRFLDFTLSLAALVVLFPLLVLLMAVGAVQMKGNPFFVQERPGRNEQSFWLIKFRTMSNARGMDGKLLPDEKRLNRYGRFLRASSLDELPQLINILRGEMSIIGPRPLAMSYLPYYTAEERRRHDVRPGLTGLAQVSGRNDLSWEEKFAFDLAYVERLSFKMDLRVLLKTAVKVFARDGIGQGEQKPRSLREERMHAEKS